MKSDTVSIPLVTGGLLEFTSLLSGFFEGGGECLHLLQELEAILSPAPSSLKQPSQRPGERETGGTGYLSRRGRVGGAGNWPVTSS